MASRMKFSYVLCLVSLTFSDIALSEEGPQVSVLGSFSLLETARTRTLRRYTVNADNKVLNIPERSLEGSVRPNMKLGLGDFTLVFRPRLTLVHDQVRHEKEWESSESHLSTQTNEGFIQWQIADDVSFTYGLQSFQWGATESASPSNRIFIDPVQARDFSTEVQGKSVARLNLSWKQRFSLVGMVEFEDSRTETQKEEQDNEAFAAAGLLKPEFNWNNGADYVGLVFGAREFHKPWLGAYLSVTAPYVEGLSFYADVAQEKGTKAFYPRLAQTLSTFRDGNWDNSNNNNGNNNNNNGSNNGGWDNNNGNNNNGGWDNNNGNNNNGGWDNGNNGNNNAGSENNGNTSASNEPKPSDTNNQPPQPPVEEKPTIPNGPALNQDETPPTDQALVEFAGRDPDQEETYRFTVYGLKYDFTDGSIFRLEYLHADNSYTKADRDLIEQAFLSKDPRQQALLGANLKGYLEKNPEMPGQDLVYASLYIPDPLDLKDVKLQGRVLHSLLDQSYGAYAQLGYEFGQGSTFFASAQWADGRPYSEMARFVRSTYSIALRQDW